MRGEAERDRLDRELMSRVRGGDVEAFEQLYRRYARPLMNFFFRMCYDRIAAEDHLQETFLRVWRARTSYRPAGRVSSWLFRIARNFWLNERAKRRLRPFHGRGALLGERAEAATEATVDPRPETRPDAVAQAAETEAALARAVSELSDTRRLVFVLCRHQGLSYGRVAEVLEIPVGTVKSRMARAEKTLRRKLHRHLGGEP
ncbi:MAG: RNA polymerase sigma factor [Planctomycetota bacterium]